MTASPIPLLLPAYLIGTDEEVFDDRVALFLDRSPVIGSPSMYYVQGQNWQDRPPLLAER